MNGMSLFRLNILVALTLHGVMAQSSQPRSLLYRRNTTLVLGKICKSMRRDCDLDDLPSDIEKLCSQRCEMGIDDPDLRVDLCDGFKKYIDGLGECANSPQIVVEMQCKEKCGECIRDEDCGKDQICENKKCKAVVSCQNNRECNGQVCKNNRCEACTANANCEDANLECVKGLCVPTINPPPECTKNSDCKATQICKNQKCSPCSIDSDCGPDQLCGDGQCKPKPPTCGQPGFEWAQWRGPRTWRTVKSPPFAEYDPTSFASQKPEHDGRTNSLLINDRRNLYGQSLSTNQAAVIHQGFLLAPETGNYTFTFGQADDIALVWLGQNAFSGWTRANADIERTYIPPPGDETQTVRLLEKGTYYPVRIAWGDKGGNVAMSVKITAPNGTELTGQDGGYFRTEACDGSYGKFPAYGPA
ncbi:hypothetical protein E4U60_000036 [Claviceps pazoutovae]|uniref:PA14 domain-containing protein n=1 Tax=Claviceps pazoutovae TaxID=1649127 RepID=A0A9P7SM31_9HYPO|nr:hypothetical protein E4U60_000036 [Claviceps pazoutovae]